MDSCALGHTGKKSLHTLEITACTGTEVPSTVAISSAGSMPLKLMAPACGSCIPLCGWGG
ncbi:unnamed protein product [Staurois parvus]|uniref:Uncharacterized protein n=1 Tax=Staurois parvus TaxID=386267 RepID=A0ABN9H316_9NEOB|nr:unnamed protein product [Staurois parvus]